MKRWRDLLTGPEDQLPLDEGALLIAAHAQPDLDVAAELGRLDELAGTVQGGEVDDVSELLFGRLGITGNTHAFDEPDNSYLNRVVERRLGIPISLSVLLIEVGRRCGAELEGVGLPGHYVVRDRRRPDTLIDAFGAGRHLDEAACAALVTRTGGADTSFHPALFATSGHRATLARMLTNLDHAFRRRQDVFGLTWVTHLRAAIPDQAVSVLVAAAGTLSELARYDEAASLLDEVAERDELPAEAAGRVRARAIAARARLN